MEERNNRGILQDIFDNGIDEKFLKDIYKPNFINGDMTIFLLIQQPGFNMMTSFLTPIMQPFGMRQAAKCV